MANVPAAPLEGSGSKSTDNVPVLFQTQDDGDSALQAVLLTCIRSATVNGQLLGALSVGLDDVQEITLLGSAARTTSVQSDDQTNRGAKGIVLTVSVTSVTDTPSITLDIEYKDAVSGVYETLFSAAAAIVATGVHTYVLYPGDIVAADDVVEVGKLPLPRTWRINVTHADADSITYSVGGCYLL